MLARNAQQQSLILAAQFPVRDGACQLAAAPVFVMVKLEWPFTHWPGVAVRDKP
jgi:hypothetical protein